MNARRWRRVALVVLVLVIAIAAILLHSTEWLASFGGRVQGARLERAKRSPQFVDGRFRNAQKSRLMKTSYRAMLRRQFFGKEQRSPLRPVPVVKSTRCFPGKRARIAPRCATGSR